MPKEILQEQAKKKKGLLDYLFLFLAFLSGLLGSNSTMGSKNNDRIPRQPLTSQITEKKTPGIGAKPPDSISFGVQPELNLPLELSFEIGSMKVSVTKITPKTLFLASAYFLVQFIQAAKAKLSEIKDRSQIDKAIQDLEIIGSGLDMCLSNPVVKTLGKQTEDVDKLDQGIWGRSGFIGCVDEYFEKTSDWLKKYRVDIPEEYANQWDEFLKDIKNMKKLSLIDMDPQELQRLFDARFSDLKRFRKTM